MIHLAPIAAVGGLGFAGYAVYRAFRGEPSEQRGPRNNWVNEDFAKRERERLRNEKRK